MLIGRLEFKFLNQIQKLTLLLNAVQFQIVIMAEEQP